MVVKAPSATETSPNPDRQAGAKTDDQGKKSRKNAKKTRTADSN
jgi:hypothetical protein